MKHSFFAALLVSAILGGVGCSKEEPEGTAEKMGKEIDEAAKTVRKEVSDAADATREQAADAKAALGAAMEEKGKELREQAEKPSE